MAIKLPDPGNGIPEQKTGNDEWTNMKIVRDNFADQSNAASRLVGTDSGNLLEVGTLGLGADSINAQFWSTSSHLTARGGIWTAGVSAGGSIPMLPDSFTVFRANHLSFGSASYPAGFVSQEGGKLAFYSIRSVNTLEKSSFHIIYNSGNTTREPGTGYIKTSSPVLNLLHNDFEKIHEAEQLDIKVENPKTGVYKISGTTGLRKNDGWYFSPPKDEHNNVLCMVEVEEDGDIVTVKTYKKKFDFETVSIVPDYDNPTDIPDGAIVMLRFNDLLQEQLDEPVI